MKYFYNIMRTWTGKIIDDDPLAPVYAADVFVANTGADPIPVTATFSPVELDVLETRVQDMSAAAINGSGGAWVELGGVDPLGATISKIQASYTAGQPLEVGTGASAGAVTRRFVMNQGEGPLNLDIVLASGAQLWVRSLSATGVTTGYITMNLMGE